MKKILIINSDYYKIISKSLLNNAIKKLKLGKFKISIINVPGVFEIPIAIRKNIKKFDGFVAFNKPIGNGIITALSMNQAIKRSIKKNSNNPNKGSEAANAVCIILKNEPKKI